jgi:hypothetical protein
MSEIAKILQVLCRTLRHGGMEFGNPIGQANKARLNCISLPQWVYGSGLAAQLFQWERVLVIWELNFPVGA